MEPNCDCNRSNPQRLGLACHSLYYVTMTKTMIILLSFHRAGRAVGLFLCGRREMVGGVEITARVMATPTASTPSPSAAQQKVAASPGTWKNVPPLSPPPTAVAKTTTARS